MISKKAGIFFEAVVPLLSNYTYLEVRWDGFKMDMCEANVAKWRSLNVAMASAPDRYRISAVNTS